MEHISFKLSKKQLEKLNSKLGVDLLELIEEIGGTVERLDKKESRFLVLNKGAHSIEDALRKQFGDVEIIYFSEGNIDIGSVEEIAVKVAREYDSDRDIILLSGPAILSVLSTLLSYVKSPEKVRVAQFDLSRGEYVVFEISHLKLRSLLSK